MRFRSHLFSIGCALLIGVPWVSAQTLAFDLQGKPVNDLTGQGTRAVVLIFAATDCPISNRYVPEIERLRAEWQPKGVRFWWVFPNPEDTVVAVKKHNREFSIATPVLLDAQQNLVHLAHASVTPEAAVFQVRGGDLRETYHGRIDDRYRAFGVERPQPTSHELTDAIETALGGHSVAKPETDPVGCAIVPLHGK